MSHVNRDPVMDPSEPCVEEEEPICRVCRCEGTADHVLYMPCQCKGSVQYVHEDCLRQWIDYSHKRECEICKHAFTFQAVYADNAPADMSVLDFSRFVLRKILPFTTTAIRYVLVAASWTIVFPLILSGAWSYLSSDDGIGAYIHDVTTNYKSFAKAIGIGGFFCFGVIAAVFIVDHVRDVIFADQADQPLFPNDHLNDAEARAPPARRVAPRPNVVDDGAVRRRRQDVRHEVDVAAPGAFAHRRGEDEELDDDLVVDEGLANPDDRHPPWRAGDANVRLRNGDGAQFRPAGQPVDPLFDDGDDDGDDDDDDDDDDDEDEDEMMGGLLNDPEINEELALGRMEAIEFFGFVGPISNFVQQFFISTLLTHSFMLLFIYAPMRLGRIPLEVLFHSYLNHQCSNLSADASPLVGLLSQASSQLSSQLSSLFSAINVLFPCDAPPPIVPSIFAGYLAFFILLGIITNIFSRIAPAHVPWVLTASWRFAKIMMMFCVHVLLIPVFCGTVMAVLCSEFLNVTRLQWLSFVATSPLTSFVMHWSMGMLFVFQLSIQIDAMRKTLRPGVLWFLWNLDDPNFRMLEVFVRNPILSHIRSTITTGIFFATLIALLIRVPLRVARSCVPWLFPLSMDLNLHEMIILQVAYPLVFKLLRSKTGVRPLYRSWLRIVGEHLGLTSYLLGDGSVRPVYFKLRIVALLVAGWITLATILASLTSVILLLGSLFLKYILQMHPPNDAFTLASGVFILRAIVSLLATRSRFFSAACKAILVGILWFVVVPLLAGLLFELAILFPVRVADDRAPAYSIWREWLLGLLFVKVVMFLCTMGMLGPHRAMAVQRVFEEGGMTLTRMSLPIIHTLLLLILAPYVMVHGVLPHLGVSAFAIEWIHRRLYICMFVVYVVSLCVSALKRHAARWHDLVRDELYLVGRKLQNHHSHMEAAAGNIMNGMAMTAGAASASSASAL